MDKCSDVDGLSYNAFRSERPAIPCNRRMSDVNHAANKNEHLGAQVGRSRVALHEASEQSGAGSLNRVNEMKSAQRKP